MNRVWPERPGRLVHTREVRLQGLPALCPALRLPRRDPLPAAPLFSIASFPSATSSIIWRAAGPTPICDAANYGCPSFAAPAVDRWRTLMGLIGSGMGLLAVTWSKPPPAEHPISRMTRRDVQLSLVRGRQLLPPRHAGISGVNSTPRPTAVLRFSGPRVARDARKTSLPSRLLGFERTRLSLASSFQLSSRTPHTALLMSNSRLKLRSASPDVNEPSAAAVGWRAEER